MSKEISEFFVNAVIYSGNGNNVREKRPASDPRRSDSACRQIFAVGETTREGKTYSHFQRVHSCPSWASGPPESSQKYVAKIRLKTIKRSVVDKTVWIRLAHNLDSRFLTN
jgi:hypothetical protein